MSRHAVAVDTAGAALALVRVSPGIALQVSDLVLWVLPLGDELPWDMRIPSDKQDKLHGCLEHLFNQVTPLPR